MYSLSISMRKKVNFVHEFTLYYKTSEIFYQGRFTEFDRISGSDDGMMKIFWIDVRYTVDFLHKFPASNFDGA